MSGVVRPDGLLATADSTMTVYLQSTGDLEATVATLRPEASVFGMHFSPDGQTLAMALSDNTIRMYDVSDPAAPTQVGEPLTGPTSIPNTVKFSPDGERLAVAAIGGQAWIYAQRDDDWVATEVLRAGLSNLQDVAWSADGSTLLGGGLSGQTRLWLTDVEVAAQTVCAGVSQPVTPAEWEGLLPGIDYAAPCGEG